MRTLCAAAKTQRSQIIFLIILLNKFKWCRVGKVIWFDSTSCGQDVALWA